MRQAFVIRMMKAEEFALTKGRKAVFKAKKSGSIDVVSMRFLYYVSLYGCPSDKKERKKIQ